MRISNNSAKTHCPRGHEYTLENTRLTAKNQRQCKLCQREDSKKSKKKRRDQGLCTRGGCCNTADVNPKTNDTFMYCPTHQEEHRQRSKGHYRANKKKYNDRSKRLWATLRSNFLDMYGGECQCCGINQPEFLALDHVRNNGKEHRATRGKFGVYEDAISMFDPEEYKILCHNCNFAKYAHGVCPHALVLGGLKDDI